MQDRRVAFGLAATMIALKAKAGRLQLNDQIQFAMRTLDLVHDDQAAREAAVSFLTNCRLDASRAGTELQDFVLTWSDGVIDPAGPETVLAAMPETTADWQSTDAQETEMGRSFQ